MTGQLGRKEGRPMATEILSDSGPVLAVPMGSECFLPLWNAREHPSNVSAEQNNSSTKSTFTHWERVAAVSVLACRPRKKGFAIIRNNTRSVFVGVGGC